MLVWVQDDFFWSVKPSNILISGAIISLIISTSYRNTETPNFPEFNGFLSGIAAL